MWKWFEKFPMCCISCNAFRSAGHSAILNPTMPILYKTVKVYSQNLHKGLNKKWLVLYIDFTVVKQQFNIMCVHIVYQCKILCNTLYSFIDAACYMEIQNIPQNIQIQALFISYTSTQPNRQMNNYNIIFVKKQYNNNIMVGGCRIEKCI